MVSISLIPSVASNTNGSMDIPLSDSSNKSAWLMLSSAVQKTVSVHLPLRRVEPKEPTTPLARLKSGSAGIPGETWTIECLSLMMACALLRHHKDTTMKKEPVTPEDKARLMAGVGNLLELLGDEVLDPWRSEAHRRTYYMPLEVLGPLVMDVP